MNHGPRCTCWRCFSAGPLSDQAVAVVEPNGNRPEPAPDPRALSHRPQRQRRDSAGTGRGQPDSPLTRDGDNGDSRDTRRTSWTAAELMATDFPEPRWAVPGLVPEGINLFAGPPKVGKSWLSLGLAVAVATGGKALGRIDVEEGASLYLALEDTPRRLKSRLATVLAGSPAPASLTIAVECPPLAAGGDERIADWLDRNPDARLVIIDVFARVRGPVLRELSAYEADYVAVTRAKALADAYGVAIVLVHHTRKASDEDFVATVSGTYGIAGASDAIAVLKRTRGKADGLLSITGRDVDEAEYALTFAPDIGAWQLSDTPADEVRLIDSQAEILAFLRENEGVGPKAVADGTGLDYGLVKKTMRRMADRGVIDTDGHGRYWAPVSPVPAVSVPGQSGDKRGQPCLRVVSDEDF